MFDWLLVVSSVTVRHVGFYTYLFFTRLFKTTPQTTSFYIITKICMFPKNFVSELIQQTHLYSITRAIGEVIKCAPWRVGVNGGMALYV